MEILSTKRAEDNRKHIRFGVMSSRQLSLPFQASEVICDSEVHLVGEVSPDSEVTNLTSLVRSTNFTAKHLHFHDSENFTNITKKERTFRL